MVFWFSGHGVFPDRDIFSLISLYLAPGGAFCLRHKTFVCQREEDDLDEDCEQQDYDDAVVGYELAQECEHGMIISVLIQRNTDHPRG